MNGVGQQIQQHLAHPLRVDRHLPVALVVEAEAAAVVLGEHRGVLREGLHQRRGVLRPEVELERARVGAGEEEELVDDLVESRDLLQLYLDPLALRRRELPVHQHLLGVQADERERDLQLVRGVRGEPAHLVEGGLQPVEHLVEQARQVGDLVVHVGNRNALAQVVGADPFGGIADQSHRPEDEAGQAEPDEEADDDHRREQEHADLDVAVHHVAHRPQGSRDGHLERHLEEFLGAHLADVGDLDGVRAHARHVGDVVTDEVGGAEDHSSPADVHLNVEQRRSVVGELPDARLDRFRAERAVIRSQPRVDLAVLRLDQEIEAVHQLLLQQQVASHEQAGERGGRGGRVPGGDPRADRLHSS